MCGITGLLSPNPALVDRHRLRTATSLLAHRGPEGEGYYEAADGRVALGHRRLCIIDESERAAQPMTLAARYHLVYNGELYNYLELRQRLQGEGHQFRSSSDTEVVLTAYAAWGKDCLLLFDGAFAFAIWDEKEQTLFAARDRLGEKPFFYTQSGETFLFASGIRALQALGASEEVNTALLYNFLTLGYAGNPADGGETFYQAIRKLPAAHSLLFTLPTGELLIERYWAVYPEAGEESDEKETIERFEALLSRSVQTRLRSDVPIGTSLSGGLDSSSVVALCAEAAAAQWSHQCFTATFPFARDERAFAETVARQFNCRQHLVTVEGGEVVSLMEQVMRAQEEPILSGSPLAQYAVYGAARAAGVKVVLDGQGADELLGGYRHHYPWYWRELYARRQLEKSGELKAARALGVNQPFGLREKAAALLPHLAGSIWEGRQERRAARHPDLHPDFATAHRRQSYYTQPLKPTLNGVLYFNTFLQGLEDLLRLADRNSMAHSVEVRLPFLQHELVELLFRLPPSYKIRQGWSKWILRKAMEHRLPEAITWRRDKVGFEPPQEEWMKHSQVAEAIRAGREKLVGRGILDPSVLKRPFLPESAHGGGTAWRHWSVALMPGI
jgi:asparagine synthase (glutamine-hydrolysing)